MAKFWAIKGDPKQPREWLDRAVKAEPNSVRVHLAYADWLLQQNEVEQAKIHVDTALKIKADDVEVQKLQGLIARIQKDLGASSRRSSVASPTTPRPTSSRPISSPRTRRSDRRSPARTCGPVGRRQCSAEPEIGRALATLGYIYFRTNRVDDALKALGAATQGGQASSDTAYYLALCLNDKEKYDDAKKLLDGALKSKGLFVYRKEAKDLFDKLEKKTAAAPKGTTPPE